MKKPRNFSPNKYNILNCKNCIYMVSKKSQFYCMKRKFPYEWDRKEHHMFMQRISYRKKEKRCCKVLSGGFPNYRKSPEYTAWISMKSRCQKSFLFSKRYWKRGITVSPRWKCFETFLNDMGLRPSKRHSLDRIDNNKGYSRKNCRWATSSEQQNNTGYNVILKYGGKKMTASEWARELGIDRSLIYSRKRMGWSDSKTLTTPKNPK